MRKFENRLIDIVMDFFASPLDSFPMKINHIWYIVNAAQVQILLSSLLTPYLSDSLSLSLA